MAAMNFVREAAGALAGLLAGAVALGVAELTAAVTGARGAPVVAVGEAAINLTPVPVKEFAITHFGTHDKLALITGILVRIPGLTPFVTPNAGFYRVDTDLALPQLSPQAWTLKIDGMVGRELEISFADLLRMPLTEADITLVCVSNEVGGTYNGNARWLGVPLAGLLRRAGVRAGADQVLSSAADGMTISTPVETIMDGPPPDGQSALLAVGMNGQPLPVAHGFPARMIVPGLYGYVSATKWVTRLTLTTGPGQGRTGDRGGGGLGAPQGHRRGRGQRGRRPPAPGPAGRRR